MHPIAALVAVFLALDYLVALVADLLNLRALGIPLPEELRHGLTMLPFSLWKERVLKARFGFNRAKPKTRRTKRIALFDTLVEGQSTEEVVGIVAHEVGHYKLGHIPRTVGLHVLQVPFMTALNVLDSALDRHREFQADAYAVATAERLETLVRALGKLAATNLENVAPHPFNVLLHDSHPPVLERVAALR